MQHVARANIGAWAAQLGHRLRHIWGHDGAVQAVAISPDGTAALIGANDYTARLWDVVSGAPIGEPLRHRQKDVRGASFSPDGKLVLTADKFWARLWDATSRRPLGDPIQHDRVILAASFSPDGARFVTMIEGGTALLWDTASRQCVAEMSGYTSNYSCFRPDGKALVLGSQQPQVWDLTSFKPLASGADDRVTTTADRVTAAVYRRGSASAGALCWISGSPRRRVTEFGSRTRRWTLSASSAPARRMAPLPTRTNDL